MSGPTCTLVILVEPRERGGALPKSSVLTHHVAYMYPIHDPIALANISTGTAI